MAKASKTPPAPAQSQSAKATVTVDRAEFIRTRDALTSAYVHLSMSMDRMVKAYLEHTQIVLDGDDSLNVSYLLGPLNGAVSAVQALSGTSAAATIAAAQPTAIGGEDIDEKPLKKQRKERKPRDPDAPKRPLTAYFRYLQEQRVAITHEIQANPKKFETDDGKQPDVSKIASDRWNLLSGDEKEPYHAAYRKDLHEYEKAVEAYRASVEADKAAAAVNAAAGGDAFVSAAGNKTSRQPEDVSTDSDDSSDDSSDSDDDDEEEEEQPAPKAPTSAKKSSTKKAPAASSKTANSATVAAATKAAEAPAASKPERKRKAPAAAAATTAEAEEPAKKKRNVRKPKSDEVVEPDTPAKAAELPATRTPAAKESAKKKEKEKEKEKDKPKEKKRKSVGA